MNKNMKHNEKLAFKYKYLREKIIFSYRKGCKILDIVKVIFALLFILFTIFSVQCCQESNSKAEWLIVWVLVIFMDVNIFIITDYFKHLIKTKVIPYLEDDDKLEFDEYALFEDDFDEDEDEEDED